METNDQIQPRSIPELPSAVDTFGAQLDAFLSYKGLPQDNVLVLAEHRSTVFRNIDTAIARLNDEQRSSSAYISKFVAACAMGLFDAALNYLWNETVQNLRAKVVNFDLEYFYASLSSTVKYKNESNLDQISDWALINGCRTTGIITENGFRHLDYIRYMRNHASAAHPNQLEITGLQIVSWLETCIIEVLSQEPSGPVIEIQRLLHNLRTETFEVESVAHIANGLQSLTEDLAASLLRSVVGLYADSDSDVRIRDNIKLIAPSLWEIAPDDARREIGLKQATLDANGEIARARLTREFIEIVAGQEALADTTLAAEIASMLDNLMSIHEELNNFYNEPAPANALHRLVMSSRSVPNAVRSKYIRTITMCRIGNGYGVSWGAQRYYDDLIGRFSDTDISVFVNLVEDVQFASRLQFTSCARHYQALATSLQDRVVRAWLKDVLVFITEYHENGISKIGADRQYRQLRSRSTV